MRYLLAVQGWVQNRMPVVGIYRKEAECSEEEIRRRCVAELSRQLVLTRIVRVDESVCSHEELVEAIQTAEWWEKHERDRG